MNSYIVLIADLENSKQLGRERRKEVQEKLRFTLDEFNRQDNHIVSPYTFIYGNEFQAVYRNAEYLFDHCWKILSVVYPVKVRFSLSAGNIITGVNRKQTLGMDGPAFHMGREGIEQMKKDKTFFRIAVENKDNPEVRIINYSLLFLSRQIRKWNRNRIAMVQMLRSGLDYKAITQKLNISEVAFYKNKKTASLDPMNGFFDSIGEFLNRQLNI